METIGFRMMAPNLNLHWCCASRNMRALPKETELAKDPSVVYLGSAFGEIYCARVMVTLGWKKVEGRTKSAG